jgi:hypothetical protein
MISSRLVPLVDRDKITKHARQGVRVPSIISLLLYLCYTLDHTLCTGSFLFTPWSYAIPGDWKFLIRPDSSKLMLGSERKLADSIQSIPLGI